MGGSGWSDSQPIPITKPDGKVIQPEASSSPSMGQENPGSTYDYCVVNNFEYFSLKLDQQVFQTPNLTNSALSIYPPKIACFPLILWP